MEIKYTILGMLIYEAIGLYLLAILMCAIKCYRASMFIYGLGFLSGAAAVVYRWMEVGHFPLQNLFEVFLFLGVMVFPLSVLSIMFLKTKGFMADIFIGVVLLVPAGFVFSAEPQVLPPILQSVFFVPHVLVYMLAYVVLAKGAVLAGMQIGGTGEHENTAYKLTCVGFPLMTLGLILGSVWGKMAWGHYWNWDPKELWSLATWLVYVGYFHFRARYAGMQKMCSVWLVVGFAFIVITLLWVNLSNIFAGLHSYA